MTTTYVVCITAAGAGRRLLADWFAESPAEGPPPWDELIAKVLLATAGGGGERSGPGDDAALAEALVRDALVIRAESELRWLDQCEARLLSRRSAGATTRRST